jgi:hypothetical protein
MANTYVAIASTTVGSGGVNSVDFTSIPQTYTDLVVKISVRSSNDTLGFNMNINNSSSSISSRWIEGTGSGVSSYTSANSQVGYQNRNAATASTFANVEIYISDYTSSNNKSYSGEGVTENNATLAFQYFVSLLRSNTAAIDRLTFVHPDAGQTFVQYSTFTIYGIKKD